MTRVYPKLYRRPEAVETNKHKGKCTDCTGGAVFDSIWIDVLPLSGIRTVN